MKYGIFGDIHGNIEAFQEVVRAYAAKDIDRYICVGDIVGYGADPARCIEEVKRLNVETVCGNHERASTGLMNADYFNYAAKAAVERTKEILSEEDKEFLKSLELVINKDDFSVVHGSLVRPDFFYYIMDILSAENCFRKMERDLCFIGHSHVPRIFFMEEGEVKRTFDNFITLKPGVKYIVNVGSVGQPRDGDPRAAFCIFDDKKRTIEIKRVDYDIESARKKILESGLPAKLGERLLEGR